MDRNFIFRIYIVDNLPLIFVGALTSKFSSFSFRPWEFVSKKSIDFFDFFSFPVTFFVSGNKIVRVSSFELKFWISDSIRFLSSFLDSVMQLSISVKYRGLPSYKLGWRESSNLVSSFLFDTTTGLYWIKDQSYEISSASFLPDVSGRVTNLVSVGENLDVNDLANLYSRFFMLPRSSMHISNLNGFDFSACSPFRFNFEKGFGEMVSDWPNQDLISNWLGFQYVFIFQSNLRYESPLANFRVSELYRQAGVSSFFFGTLDLSYMFTYPVFYGGAQFEIFSLISGRVRTLSRYFFSDLSISIFGSRFFVEFSDFFVSWFRSVMGMLHSVLFLQSDFSKNSNFLFRPNKLENVSSVFYISKRSKFYFPLNIFAFNVYDRVYFSSRRYTYRSNFQPVLSKRLYFMTFFSRFWFFNFLQGSVDFIKFCSVKNFIFGQHSRQFKAFSKFSCDWFWSCLFPVVSIACVSNAYLTLSNYVSKTLRVVDSSSDAMVVARPSFSTISYMFLYTFNVFIRYRQYCFLIINDLSFYNFKNQRLIQTFTGEILFVSSRRFRKILFKYSVIGRQTDFIDRLGFGSYVSLFSFLYSSSFYKLYSRVVLSFYVFCSTSV